MANSSCSVEFYRIEIFRNRLTVILEIFVFKNFFVVIKDLAPFLVFDWGDLLPRCCCVFRFGAIIKIINLRNKFLSRLSDQTFVLTVLLKDPRLIACL